MFRRYTWQMAYIIVRLDPSTPLDPFHHSPPLCTPTPYLIDPEVNGEFALAAVDLAYLGHEIHAPLVLRLADQQLTQDVHNVQVIQPIVQFVFQQFDCLFWVT